MQAQLLLVLFYSASLRAATAQNCGSYSVVSASLCITSEFIETPLGVGPASELDCALQCSSRQRCQAFSTADGPCQLFVFDKCSKGVRNCSCSRTGQLFVKRRAGLQPGKLCPSDFAQQRCGVRYKARPSPGDWWQARQSCENNSGLVITADVTDASEMSFIDSEYNADYFSKSQSLWLGGFQSPVVPASKSGWTWVNCNLTVDSSLWSSPGPNNIMGNEVTIGRYAGYSGLSDFNPSIPSYKPSGVLCECVSPFD